MKFLTRNVTKASTRILISVVVALASACAHNSTTTVEHFYDSPEQDFYRDKMIQNMKLAGPWVIENGVRVYSETGRDALFDYLANEWGVQLWMEPEVENENYLAQFRIKARGIYYQIYNLHREEIDGQLYEFWTIKVTPTSWSGETVRSIFFVTTAADKFGQRNILQMSDRFIENYKVDTEATITFPINNLELLYIMEPWRYPQNYEDSSLAGIRVEHINGRLVRADCVFWVCSGGPGK